MGVESFMLKHHGKDAAFYSETRTETKMSKGRGQLILPFTWFLFLFMLEFDEERIEMFRKAVPHMKVINLDNMPVNYASDLEIEASVF